MSRCSLVGPHPRAVLSFPGLENAGHIEGGVEIAALAEASGGIAHSIREGTIIEA